MGQATALKHFNSIVAENAMKSANIHPEENRYYWDDADAFVKLGEDNGMFIIGHCLVWHSQCSPWFLVLMNIQRRAHEEAVFETVFKCRFGRCFFGTHVEC